MTTSENLQNVPPRSPAGHWRASNDPLDIVNDPSMSPAAKRALLASWASDARAVPNHPGLRRLDSGALVSIDDVLDALKMLDGSDPSDADGPLSPLRGPRRGHWSQLSRLWRRRHRDDDDDDPFSPAPAGIGPRPPVDEGAMAAAA